MRVPAVKCDRCPTFALLEGENLPSGWVVIFDKDLCPECRTALTTFLQPIAEKAPSA